MSNEGKMIGSTVCENIVFKGTEPQPLGAQPIPGGQFTLYSPPSDSLPGSFEEGVDFIVDYEAGTIARTEHSRIPDWRTHPIHGKEGFDHRDYPFYSNAGYTCKIEYTAAPGIQSPSRLGGLSNNLSRLHERLTMDKQAVCVIYGDSISTGAEASSPEHSFFGRFIAALRERYPNTDIQPVMKAVGGETSSRGLERIGDVIASSPDLVIIGYGMNDQNRNADGSNATPVSSYEQIIRLMAESIHGQTGADIVLVTPCLPNPKWIFASGNVREYADALRRIAKECGYAIADAQAEWENVLSSGVSHESLLLNNVNHPNDFGHAIYYRAFEQLFV